MNKVQEKNPGTISDKRNWRPKSRAELEQMSHHELVQEAIRVAKMLSEKESR